MSNIDKHHLDPKIIKQVKDSYIRCQENEKFFDLFYKTLLGKSEEIAAKFEHTDWVRQHNLIKLGIKSAILYAEQPDYAFAQKNIDDIGTTHSHSQWDIKPEFYPLWLDSVVETVKECDPAYSLELSDAWRKVLTPAIQLIISKY